MVAWLRPGGITKGCEETSGSERYVHYLGCANDFKSMHTHQNVKSYINVQFTGCKLCLSKAAPPKNALVDKIV